MTSAKQIREAMSLTQCELAQGNDLSDRTIRDFEMGRLVPTLRTRRKLATAYRVTLDQVDALARGETVEWTGALAAPGTSNLQQLQRDVENVIAERAFTASAFIRDMCTSDEESDILSQSGELAIPQFMLDIRAGLMTPLVQQRMAHAKALTAA